MELIISEKAYYIAKQELGLELEDIKKKNKNTILSFLNLSEKENLLKIHLNSELWASPASGSYESAGMIIAPCQHVYFGCNFSRVL